MIFREYGFAPDGSYYYFPTYASSDNTWSKPEVSGYQKLTLDYVMSVGKNNHKVGFCSTALFFDILGYLACSLLQVKSWPWVYNFDVKDYKVDRNSDMSFSDHNAVFARIKTRCKRRR